MNILDEKGELTMVDFTCPAGLHINEAAQIMIQMANQQQEEVSTTFNDIILVAKPDSTTIEDIVHFFEEERRRRYGE